eukprot:gene33022-42721_t
MGTRMQEMEEKYLKLDNLYKSLLLNSTKLVPEPSRINATNYGTLEVIRSDIKEIKSQTNLNENKLTSVSADLQGDLKKFVSDQQVNFESLKQSLQKLISESTVDIVSNSKLNSILEDLKKDIEAKLVSSPTTAIDNNLPDRIQKVEDAIEAIKAASTKAKEANDKNIVGLRTGILALEEKLLSIIAREISTLTVKSASTTQQLPLPVIESPAYEKIIQEMSGNVSEVKQQLSSANELILQLQKEVSSFGSSAVVVESGNTPEAAQRLDAIDAQISEFQLLRTSLDKRFLEWAEKLSVVERNITAAVEKKYVEITSSVSQLKSELQAIESSLLATAQKLESRMSEMNTTQVVLLADMSVELSAVKADFSRGLVQLNDMVKSSSMDFDESLEQLDSKQNSAVEQMKALMSQSVLNSSMKAQALSDRLTELSVQIQTTTTSEKSSREALETELSSLKKEVSTVFQEIRQEYVSKIDSKLVAFNDSFVTAISGSESRARVQLAQMSDEVKTELLSKINTLEAATTAKIAQVEKSSQTDISTLRADTENEKKVMEGKVDYKVSGLQKDVKRFREEIESIVGNLDDSIETRIVDTVDRLSLRQRLKRKVVSLWNTVKKSVAAAYAKSVGKLYRKLTQERP